MKTVPLSAVLWKVRMKPHLPNQSLMLLLPEGTEKHLAILAIFRLNMVTLSGEWIAADDLEDSDFCAV